MRKLVKNGKSYHFRSLPKNNAVTEKTFRMIGQKRVFSRQLKIFGMIQRVQSLYLFLVVLLSAIMLTGGFISVYMMPLAILLIVIMLVSVVGIFMYKKRKQQRMLVIIAIFIDIVAIALGAYYLYLMKKGESNVMVLNFRIVIPVVNLILLLLASRGIKKDDDLVKSYDRLR